jgi:transcription antitermination factor NusG
MIGTVISVDAENSRVKANVEMFGRETPVELGYEQIRRLGEN